MQLSSLIDRELWAKLNISFGYFSILQIPILETTTLTAQTMYESGSPWIKKEKFYYYFCFRGCIYFRDKIASQIMKMFVEINDFVYQSLDHHQLLIDTCKIESRTTVGKGSKVMTKSQVWKNLEV